MSDSEDVEALKELGVRYSDSFLEIDREGDSPKESADRLWSWMAQLINDAYQIGKRSSSG